MLDGIEILTAALVDFGTDALVGGDPLRVIPDLGGKDVFFGEMVDHTGPFATALKSAVDAIAPATGNSGDTITILGRNFTILAIAPDEDGGVILTLEEK